MNSFSRVTSFAFTSISRMKFVFSASSIMTVSEKILTKARRSGKIRVSVFNLFCDTVSHTPFEWRYFPGKSGQANWSGARKNQTGEWSRKTKKKHAEYRWKIHAWRRTAPFQPLPVPDARAVFANFKRGGLRFRFDMYFVFTRIQRCPGLRVRRIIIKLQYAPRLSIFL